MNAWGIVLGKVKTELVRTSQRVGDYRVIPDRIEIDLPSSDYDRWRPVLGSVVEEIGEALQSWASSSEALWHDASGPHLWVRLQPIATIRIRCHFGT